MSRLWVVFSRNYSRWTSRRPVKMYYPELQEDNQGENNVIDISSKVGIEELKYTKQDYRKSKDKFYSRPGKAHSKENHNNSIDLKKVDKLTYFPKGQNKPVSTLNERPKRINNSHFTKVTKEGDQNVYEKLSNNDPDIGNLLLKLKSSKHRLSSNLILVEGRRMIHDALVADSILEKLIFSRKEDFEMIRPFMNKEAKAYKMSYKEIQHWSDLDTCPGMIGIFKKPRPDQIQSHRKSLPIQVICDNIRDPNNLGAILRAAVGIGCKNILLTKGCVDLWNPKSMRSGSGAHFQIPVYNRLEWDEISNRCKNSVIYIADNNIFVNRENELDEEKYFQDNRISKHHDKLINKAGTVDVTNDASDSEKTSDDEDEEEQLTKEEVEKFRSEIPSIPYYAGDFSHLNPMALIIGGETEGISSECYRFGFENNATCLNIPLMNGIESLNVGMALAVIAFEMKKQIIQATKKKQDEKQLKVAHSKK